MKISITLLCLALTAWLIFLLWLIISISLALGG